MSRTRAIIILIIGVLLCFHGVYKLFIKGPHIGLSAKFQPMISDGWPALIVGVGFIIGGIIQARFRKRKSRTKNGRLK